MRESGNKVRGTLTQGGFSDNPTYPVQGVQPLAVSAESLQQSQWPLR